VRIRSRPRGSERVVSDFRSGFTASRLADQRQQRGLGSSFEPPSVYITGPTGIEATSNDRIIQRGDLVIIDWGVGHLNTWTDVKRMAYVLEPGETAVPMGLQAAFDNALRVRDVIRRTIRPGPTDGAMPGELQQAITGAGFRMQGTFNEVTQDGQVEARCAYRARTTRSSLPAASSGSTPRTCASRRSAEGGAAQTRGLRSGTRAPIQSAASGPESPASRSSVPRQYRQLLVSAPAGARARTRSTMRGMYIWW
jgi:hypothetical protein